MAGATWNCCCRSARSVYITEPCTSLQCHFIWSHMRWVHVCLAVTCHLHFRQNDQDLSQAAAVIQGWNGYQSESERRNWPWRKEFSCCSYQDLCTFLFSLNTSLCFLFSLNTVWCFLFSWNGEMFALLSLFFTYSAEFAKHSCSASDLSPFLSFTDFDGVSFKNKTKRTLFF